MQRARKVEHKQARAKDILDAALSLYRARGFAAFTMADLAAEVGLAKGTVFLYFPTKEALGLALTERLLGEWFDEIDDRLSKLRAPATAGRVAKQFSESVTERMDLVGLLALLGTLLEHNVDEPTAVQFKQFLAQRLAMTGALLEKTLPFLPSDGGARLLLHLHALVIGLYPHACPSDVVARALRHPGLELLRLDFPTELRVSTRALIEGMRALSLQSGKEP